MSYVISTDAFVRRPRHGVTANDNFPHAPCIEVFDAVDGWKIHMNFQGKKYVLDPRVAGKVAWDMSQKNPHLMSAASDLYESVKRVQLLEGATA